MKQVMYGCVLGAVVALVLLCVLTINGKKTRRGELDHALATSVESAVEATMERGHYHISNNEEFIADFTQNLLSQISNDSDIEINVAKADYEKGLLSLQVIEHFKNPNGKEGQYKCETTVVMENVRDAKHLCKITYLLDDTTVYKEYQIQEGDCLVVPKAPTREGEIFVGWKDMERDEMASKSTLIDGNKQYIAFFKKKGDV